MIVLPATGVSMGYFGGAGLPFFFTKFTPASGKCFPSDSPPLATSDYYSLSLYIYIYIYIYYVCVCVCVCVLFVCCVEGEFGKAANGKLAGQSYGIHKQVGQVFK